MYTFFIQDLTYQILYNDTIPLTTMVIAEEYDFESQSQ
jgi:hypothetical protein